MEEKDLEFFKHFLMHWMEELLNHADETVEELLDPQENLADPLDRAASESDRLRTLRMRDRESMLIKKSDNLWRISKMVNMVFARIAVKTFLLNG